MNDFEKQVIVLRSVESEKHVVDDSDSDSWYAVTTLVRMIERRIRYCVADPGAG